MTKSSDHNKQVIELAHGGGGRLMNDLIRDIFAEAFGHRDFDARHDSALLPWHYENLVFTTDSFVVNPLFFPGGDIGSMAVNGTVNDLAMRGACPMYLSAGFIIEEGMPVDTLARIAMSMRQAANKAGVTIVTGDTKVVERGHGDGVYINTTGIGRMEYDVVIGAEQIQPGDVILVSGDLGRHGIAVLTAREDLKLESALESDCAPLADDIRALLNEGVSLHCLRDLTRGGLVSALVELSESSERAFHILEEKIPVHPTVQAACEVLGFSPLHIANEGRFVAYLPPDDSQTAVAILAERHPDIQPVVIGEVMSERKPIVIARTILGTERVVDMISGEQLPRIC